MRAFLLRWHRRVGLMAMVFIIVVSITGIALNHTKEFGLGTLVHNRWLLALYGMENLSNGLVSVARMDESYIIYDGVNRLYRDAKEVAACNTTIFGGAVPYRQGWLALCGEELLIFDEQDRLQERIGVMQGLPANAFMLGTGEGDIAVWDGSREWMFDLDDLSARQWPAGKPLEMALAANIAANSPGLPDIPAGSTLTLEQVILDLHSGRLFGRFTVLLMDLSAVAMLLLGVSGLVVWGSRRKRRQIP